MSTNYFFLFCLFFLMVIGCSRCKDKQFDNRLSVMNFSSQSIDYHISNQFPDSTLSLSDGYGNRLASGTSDGGILISGNWEEHISQLNQATLVVFFMSTDTVELYGIQSVAANRNFLEMRFVTLSTLQSSDFKIIYE